MGGVRQPRRSCRGGAARWSRFGMLARHAPLLRPRRVSHRAVRSARVRAEHTARKRPCRRPVGEHDRAPAGRHRTAARAPRHRAVAGARRLLGLHVGPRVRRAVHRPRRGPWCWSASRRVNGPRSTGSTETSLHSFPTRGLDSALAFRRRSAMAISSPRTAGSSRILILRSVAGRQRLDRLGLVDGVGRPDRPATGAVGRPVVPARARSPLHALLRQRRVPRRRRAAARRHCARGDPGCARQREARPPVRHRRAGPRTRMA